MPPRKPSSSGAPSSKPPSSRGKPASSRAPPVSAAPASRKVRGGTVSRGTSAAPSIPSIPENGDVDMGQASQASGTTISNGQVNGQANGYDGGRPAKKGRISEIASEAPSSRRRSSTGLSKQNVVPQPPYPHVALFVFGTGDNGQFGLGPDKLDEIGRPKLHDWFEEQIEEGKLSRDGKPGSGGLETVACGGMHTLAVDEAGHVRSWGINDNASLGRRTTDVPNPASPGSFIPNEDLESYPLVIESLEKEGFRAVQVEAGDSVSVAVSDRGEIRVWGSFRANDGILGFDGVPGHSPFQFEPIALPSLARLKLKITQVSCGENHVLALTTTGHVYVWGNGQQNQLGRRIIERRKLNALEPERLGLRNIVSVSAGMYHSFAIDENGKVYAWGLNTFHQTGISASRGGNEDLIITPTVVDSLSPEEHHGARVIQISGGEHHSIFLFDNGEVWGCGRSDANQIGIGSDHPAQEGLKERRDEERAKRQEKVDAAVKKLQTVPSGDEEVKARLEMEVAAAQAALNVALDEFIPEPVRICFPPIPEQYEIVPPFPSYAESKPSDNPIAQISAGPRNNLAVSASGHVYSWGLGLLCQLGLGSQETAEVPTLVRSKSLRPYTALYASAGGQHCVLLAKLTKDPNAMDTA